MSSGIGAPSPLQVDLALLGRGGSRVIVEGTGHWPALKGRLNRILDHLDRTYLYATNNASNEACSNRCTSSRKSRCA